MARVLRSEFRCVQDMFHVAITKKICLFKDMFHVAITKDMFQAAITKNIFSSLDIPELANTSEDGVSLVNLILNEKSESQQISFRGC